MQQIFAGGRKFAISAESSTSEWLHSQTRFVRNSFLMEAIDLYNLIKFGTEFIEDEDFREVASEPLKARFGNDNL